MTDDIETMSRKTELTRDERRAEMAETTYQSGNLFQPKNGRELIEMANVLSQSGTMISPIYRNKTGDCAGLIALCAPYGFNPIQVSWKTYKASKNDDAPIAFEAQLVNAMVNMSAPIKGKLKYEYSGEGDSRQCKVVGIDRETGEDLIYATPPKGAIKIQNSPLWKSDPDQQLGYYAARSWARRHFPEMLLGVYSADEIDVDRQPMRDVTPRETLQERLERQASEDIRSDIDQTPEVKPEDVSQDVDEAEVVGITAMPQNGFPGSDEFTEGAKAFEDETGYEDNPYAGEGGDQTKANDWAAGWNGAWDAAGK